MALRVYAVSRVRNIGVILWRLEENKSFATTRGSCFGHVNSYSQLHFINYLFKRHDILKIAARLFCSSKVVREDSGERKHCNIGTIGHVDHGKTTLTAAITKVLNKDGFSKYVSYDEIDKAPEEKARGITINVTHIEFNTKSRHYAHTDCPGHSDFVKNMISGASQMDGAVLVVAATDGQMPQTREHLLLAKQIGIEKIVVFINKVDLVDNDVVDLVEIEIRELLTDFGFDGLHTPVVCGSALLALQGDTSEFGEPAIRKLLDAIDEHIPTPERDFKSPFMLPIDNAFTVPGRGTVVIGTLKQGILNKNAEAELLGFDIKLKTTVSDVQIFKKSVPSAKAGDNLGALLRGIRIDAVKRGMLLCASGSETLSNHFKAKIYCLSKSEGGRSKPLTTKFIQQLFSKTWNIQCRVDLESDVGMIMPGEHGTVYLTLLRSMVMSRGQPFTIRENNSTVITGIITEVLNRIQIGNMKLIKVQVPNV
ncbi:elongation factor Tu [Anabrus simplex]|uniref:elongation factor Tu n=1 Tax=Anabrus simplex TaxID=316456 RepID=UPI0035A32D0C